MATIRTANWAQGGHTDGRSVSWTGRQNYARDVSRTRGAGGGDHPARAGVKEDRILVHGAADTVGMEIEFGGTGLRGRMYVRRGNISPRARDTGVVRSGAKRYSL